MVPKLLSHHGDEIAMLRDAGLTAEHADIALTAFGVGEMAFAGCLLLFWRRYWPLYICIAAMCLGMVGVMLSSPRFITAAFNPVSLNTGVACLAAVDLLVLKPKKAE